MTKNALTPSQEQKGEQVFRDWLAKPADPVRSRNELLLKIFFGTAMEPADVLRHIQRMRGEELKTQTLYQHFEKEIESRDATQERKLYWKLALSSGRHINQARLVWCDEAIKAIDKFVKESSPPNSGNQ